MDGAAAAEGHTKKRKSAGRLRPSPVGPQRGGAAAATATATLAPEFAPCTAAPSAHADEWSAVQRCARVRRQCSDGHQVASQRRQRQQQQHSTAASDPLSRLHAARPAQRHFALAARPCSCGVQMHRGAGRAPGGQGDAAHVERQAGGVAAGPGRGKRRTDRRAALCRCPHSTIQPNVAIVFLSPLLHTPQSIGASSEHRRQRR